MGLDWCEPSLEWSWLVPYLRRYFRTILLYVLRWLVVFFFSFLWAVLARWSERSYGGLQ